MEGTLSVTTEPRRGRPGLDTRSDGDGSAVAWLLTALSHQLGKGKAPAPTLIGDEHTSTTYPAYGFATLWSGSHEGRTAWTCTPLAPATTTAAAWGKPATRTTVPREATPVPLDTFVLSTVATGCLRKSKRVTVPSSCAATM
eukprot:PhM_4_TR10848/c0_g1_i1/m.67688